MQLIAPFDARQFDPTQNVGGNLPIGRHRVVITASDIKPTKDNTGGMLELELTVIDGPSVGATGAYRLNLYNASDKAKEIAHRQMSSLCHVLGVYQVNDTNALHNVPFMVEVVAQKGQGNEGYTQVQKVFDVNGNEPGKAGAAAPAAQAAPPAAFVPPAAAPGPAAAPAGWAAPQGAVAGVPQPGAFQGPAGAPPAGGWTGAPAAAGGAPNPPWVKS